MGNEASSASSSAFSPHSGSVRYDIIVQLHGTLVFIQPGEKKAQGRAMAWRNGQWNTARAPPEHFSALAFNYY